MIVIARATARSNLGFERKIASGQRALKALRPLAMTMSRKMKNLMQTMLANLKRSKKHMILPDRRSG